MANNNYFIHYGNDKPQGSAITNEVHLVKPGEFRRFDHRITPYTDVDSNVPINLDFPRYGFYVAEPNETLRDEYGFIRVIVSYLATKQDAQLLY